MLVILLGCLGDAFAGYCPSDLHQIVRGRHPLYLRLTRGEMHYCTFLHASANTVMGWEHTTDEKGQTYYYNIETGVTQWENPNPQLSATIMATQSASARLDEFEEMMKAKRAKLEAQARQSHAGSSYGPPAAAAPPASQYEASYTQYAAPAMPPPLPSEPPPMPSGPPPPPMPTGPPPPMAADYGGGAYGNYGCCGASSSTYGAGMGAYDGGGMGGGMCGCGGYDGGMGGALAPNGVPGGYGCFSVTCDVALPMPMPPMAGGMRPVEVDHMDMMASAHLTRGRGDGGPGSTRIFVGNIPMHISANEVAECFEPFGAIRDAYIPKDYHTGKEKPFCFITFQSEDSVHAAMRSLPIRCRQQDLDVRHAANKSNDKTVERATMVHKAAQAAPSPVVSYGVAGYLQTGVYRPPPLGAPGGGNWWDPAF